MFLSCVTKQGESDYLCFDLVQIVSEIVILVLWKGRGVKFGPNELCVMVFGPFIIGVTHLGEGFVLLSHFV